MFKNTIHNQCHNQQGCETKNCPVICGNPSIRKAIGHGTHGQAPSNDPTKITVVVSSTDYYQKPQKMIMYKKAYEVNSTPEHTMKLPNYKQIPICAKL